MILLRLLAAHYVGTQLVRMLDQRGPAWMGSKTWQLVGLIIHLLAFILLGLGEPVIYPLVASLAWTLIRVSEIVLGRQMRATHWTFLGLLFFLGITDLWPELMQTALTWQLPDEVIAILSAYVVILTPAGWLVQRMTNRWRQDISLDGLEGAGKWIGILERILILTFVLLGEFSAIGFLIAAKSIFRLSDKERKEAEYIIIGTLSSFTLALLVGLLLRSYLQEPPIFL